MLKVGHSAGIWVFLGFFFTLMTGIGNGQAVYVETNVLFNLPQVQF